MTKTLETRNFDNKLNASRTSVAAVSADTVIEELQVLRRTEIRDEEFWERFCFCIGALCRAMGVMAARMNPSGEWVVLGSFLPDDARLERLWQSMLGELAERAVQRKFAMSPQGDRIGGAVLVVSLSGEDNLLLLVDIPGSERARMNELILRARLAADLPEVRAEKTVTGVQTACDQEEILDLLDLISMVMREEHFGSAALALVNGVALHTGGLAALGWLKEGYVKTQAISHLDRFEHKTEIVQALESAMEEALDQESTLFYPEDAQEPRLILLAHERFCRAMGFSGAVTIPLRRLTKKHEAVLLLSLAGDGPGPSWFTQLTVVLQLLLPWLSDLRDRDRWVGARLASWCAQKAAYLVGPDHVGRKVLALSASLILLYGLVGTWSHRIDATAELVTDSTRLISAPFDGYLDEVVVTAGDDVKKGDFLASLDTQELYLQESEIRADMRRIQAEADRGRARGELAEVEIAGARLAQSRARLKKVIFFIEQAKIKAPFDAVVVEGERNELQGAPVNKGQALFRLARVEGLYIQLFVGERDIRYVDPAGRGELALLSRPDRKIPFVLDTIVPVARVRGDEGNRFLIKAALEQDPESWWRPGMGGVARIDAGDRKIAWILTRKLIDTLRIKLWW